MIIWKKWRTNEQSLNLILHAKPDAEIEEFEPQIKFEARLEIVFNVSRFKPSLN